MENFAPENKISKNFFECSVGEHSKVYHHFQEAAEGVKAYEPRRTPPGITGSAVPQTA